MPRYTFGVPLSPISVATEPAGPSRELLRSTPFLLKRLGAAANERSLEAFESTKLNPQHYAVLSLLEEGTRETQATVAEKNRARASIRIHSTASSGIIASHVHVGKPPYAQLITSRIVIEIRKSADDEMTAAIGNTSRGQ